MQPNSHEAKGAQHEGSVRPGVVVWESNSSAFAEHRVKITQTGGVPSSPLDALISGPYKFQMSDKDVTTQRTIFNNEGTTIMEPSVEHYRHYVITTKNECDQNLVHQIKVAVMKMYPVKDKITESFEFVVEDVQP